MFLPISFSLLALFRHLLKIYLLILGIRLLSCVWHMDISESSLGSHGFAASLKSVLGQPLSSILSPQRVQLGKCQAKFFSLWLSSSKTVLQNFSSQDCKPHGMPVTTMSASSPATSVPRWAYSSLDPLLVISNKTWQREDPSPSPPVSSFARESHIRYRHRKFPEDRASTVHGCRQLES